MARSDDIPGVSRAPSPHAPAVLVVEDDPAHAELIREYLAKSRLGNPVEVVGHVAEARSYLERQAADGRPGALPPLILVDRHLSGGSGLDVLEWVKNDRVLGAVPVVMLSSSGDAADIDRAQELGAASYLIKPVGFTALIETVRRLGLPWMLVAESSTAAVPGVAE